MPAEKFEFRISYKRLLIGLLATIVPISLVGLYAIEKSDGELQGTIGNHFKMFAESEAQEVAQFVHNRVVNVGVIATEPSVINVILDANRRWQGISDANVTDRIQRIEKGWNTADSEELTKAILSVDAAVRLRRYLELDPRFLRITVTDSHGATVAATHKTQDYFQADEEFWQAIYAGGRGAVSLTDILFDDVTKSSYIGIGVPVLEEGSNRFIGAVDALVDVSSLFRVVNRSTGPSSMRTVLVKDDGTVISAPEVNLSMNMRSEEFVAVQDALTTIEGRQTGYMVTEVPNLGKRLIGFADTGLNQDYQRLGWVVLVTQDADEAFASIRLVGRLTGFLALVGLAMVVLVAMYFTLHRREPFEVARPLSNSETGQGE